VANIPSTPADGARRVIWTAALANPGAPTLAELNSASNVDVSCYLTGDGWTPGLDEQTISDSRFCDRETYSRPGRSSRSLSITYVTNPGDEDFDEAASTLVDRAKGFFVYRAGPDFDEAWAVGDLVDVWPVQMGAQSDVVDGENAVLKITQAALPTGPVERRAAVVAGT